MSSVLKCVGASFTFCNPKPKEPLVYIKQHHQPTGWINSDRGCRKGSFAPSVRGGLDFRELKHSENTHSIRGKGQSHFGNPLQSELQRSPTVNWPAFLELLEYP